MSMKKIIFTSLLTFGLSTTLQPANWIIWLKNDSDFKVEGQSTANHPNYIEIQGAPGDHRTNVFTLQPHVQFQTKNFPLPWYDSREALYLTVYKPEGPQYFELYEINRPQYIGPSQTGKFERSASVRGGLTASNVKVGDNWELTIVINQQGIPEIRGKNFESLPSI